MNIFPQPKFLGGRVKVELDFTNYTAKSDLINYAGVDTSKFAKEVDLWRFMLINQVLINWKNVPTNSSHLKSKVDKLDNNKLVLAPIDLSKLIDIFKIDVYIAYIKNIADNISVLTNLATDASLSGKIN